MNKQVIALLLGLVLMGSPAQAEPITMQTAGGDVRSVLMSAARLGHLNLVLGDDVKGQVTLSLTAEPEEVLRTVAAVQGLVLVEQGGTFLITSPGQSSGLRQMHVYHIRYAEPEDLVAAVKMSLQGEGNQSGLSNKDKQDGEQQDTAEATAPAGRGASWAACDGATGSLLLYGTAAEAAQAQAILEELDVPARQVSLEAKVVALSKDASKNLGVEWEWSKLPQYPQTTKSWRYRRDGTADEYDSRAERKFGGRDMIPGIIQFGRGPSGVPFEFYYEAKLNALVTDGKAKILARPNITTVQGREAHISIGGQVPVPTQSVTNSTTTTSIEYRDAGIILTCTPRVNADGYITATVHTEVSSPLYVEDIKAYRFQKRSADTRVRLHDGETMVIGGLIGSEESRTLSKIPFLGDLPVLGAFFRNLKTTRTESEIMIFLKAHVLEDGARQPESHADIDEAAEKERDHGH